MFAAKSWYPSERILTNKFKNSLSLSRTHTHTLAHKTHESIWLGVRFWLSNGNGFCSFCSHVLHLFTHFEYFAGKLERDRRRKEQRNIIALIEKWKCTSGNGKASRIYDSMCACLCSAFISIYISFFFFSPHSPLPRTLVSFCIYPPSTQQM